MTDFNLLTKEHRVAFNYSSFYRYFFGALLVLVCALFGMHIWLSQQLEELSARLASINESLSPLMITHPDIEKKETPYQSMLIAMQSVFDTMAELNKFAICLTAMQINKGELRLFGNARSADELTHALRSIQEKQALTITELRPGKLNGLIFELRSKQHAK